MLWLLCPSLFYFVVSFKTLMPGSTRRQLMRLVLPSTMLAVIAGCSRSTSAQPAAAKPPAPAPVRADTAALRRALDSIADAHHGIVGYSVIDLENNAAISRRGDETFPTASLIKVAILVTVYDLVAKGELSLNDPLTVLKIDQVPGSGVAQHLHPGTILTVHDARSEERRAGKDSRALWKR